jgi:hypothetical protein
MSKFTDAERAAIMAEARANVQARGGAGSGPQGGRSPHTEWMDECTSVMMDRGKDQDQAVAICLHMFDSWDAETPEDSDETRPPKFQETLDAEAAAAASKEATLIEDPVRKWKREADEQEELFAASVPRKRC